MERSTDSYLHKKFKKQLSIDPKPQNYEKEKDPTRTVESCEEKAIDERIQGECNKIAENQTKIDNNESVPNQSTNQNSPSFVNTSNFSKSSISVENCIANQQSSNSCISYVVSNSQNIEEHSKHVSFDTKFNSDPTNSTVSMSSILDNVYSKQNYASKEDISAFNLQEDYTAKLNPTEENLDVKAEEVQPPPDKNSSGKYVCTYCNLVCSKPSVLQKHIRAHTNERPYPCISCGFSFKTRSNLYKHCRSRTHANRVMGNKTQESNNETDNQRPVNLPRSPPGMLENREEKTLTQDVKLKPYKPRFHTAKQFFENVAKENIEDERQNNKHATSDLISHHINEIINKNNSIVNFNESIFVKKRYNDAVVENVNNNECTPRYNRGEISYSSNATEQRMAEEPLNLTNKNRKRCMSEVAEPVVQKSLIKELLLKNLYSSDMQCPYCKMIFQTVTELDVHKYRSCKGKPSGAKYTRSSSVNVASILTHNKNAFDNIPQLQNTVFPLNSPGPFLGKTRLVDSDKSKSFSFDGGNLPLMSPNESPQNYLLCPLHFDKEKKAPIKLFGGEVKIHSSGETKSFKIDNKHDKFEPESNYIDYGGKLSENRVIKSSLQSGGTVLTNKTNYSKQDLKASQDVIRVYENTSLSPSIDISSFNKSKFNFDRQYDSVTDTIYSEVIMRQRIDPNDTAKNVGINNSLYNYTNIMDFSQKAVKMLTPNIKQPNISVSGVSIPGKSVINLPAENKSEMKLDCPNPKIGIENDANVPQNLSISSETETNTRNNTVKKQLFLQRKLPYEPKPTTPANNIYNPVNLLVNGQVVRYVPGIPGPVAAEAQVDMAYGSNIITVGRSTQKEVTSAPQLILDKVDSYENSKLNKSNHFLQPEPQANIERINRSPKLDASEIKMDYSPKTNEIKTPTKISESKSPVKFLETKSPDNVNISETKKFVRPNSLALKPTTASLKQHHGLTPTMFNQILISPDTPRVAKKYAEHFLHGNYFSYLGLKSSTKPVYCTLNKTQPFYVPHFKKLSMYSEWRQQDTKTDKLYVSNYDSRQKNQRYTVAGKTMANLIIHSSYKFMVSEVPCSKAEKGEEQQKNITVLGGYECNEDYTYIRGRGRGRYVCDQCGIRCKKPSMLKKHIRTHSNDRPYTCSHCNFSFKTKGNLTKHMKSKAHTKNYTASSSSGSSTQQSATQSSESDTDDSGMDSSDESTRQQEHEAAYGLLSLSQKPTQGSTTHSQSDLGHLQSSSPVSTNEVFMSSEELAYVSKTNYAKNKILDERSVLSFSCTKNINESTTVVSVEETMEAQNIRNYLGKSSINRPLTYPYTTALPNEKDILPSPKAPEILNRSLSSVENVLNNVENSPEPKSIKQFHVIQKYAVPQNPSSSPKISATENLPSRKIEISYNSSEAVLLNNKNLTYNANRVLPTLKVNDVIVTNENINDLRKRKFPITDNKYKNKIQRNDEVIDLSMTTIEKQDNLVRVNGMTEEHHQFNNTIRPTMETPKHISNDIYNTVQMPIVPKSPRSFDINEDEYSKEDDLNYKNSEMTNNNGTVIILRPLQAEEHVNVNYAIEQQNNAPVDQTKNIDYDNSAMETLADIATKQVKLEKNTLAKSVATEFLKLATKNENLDNCRDSGSFGSVNKDVNDIIVKSEGNKSCTICSKSFNKPSQLRLHMNIHYLERPFRCEPCSVSFRTKGHLQKHERSASHHNKLSSSPALSSSEPRPFKCSDCNIAFRIHGHLAKHLRSKMHIMKLECLAKIPFGLYAELERSNSLLTEINTCDGDQCLESLKTLAKKVFINDPNKLNQLELRENINADS